MTFHRKMIGKRWLRDTLLFRNTYCATRIAQRDTPSLNLLQKSLNTLQKTRLLQSTRHTLQQDTLHNYVIVQLCEFFKSCTWSSHVTHESYIMNCFQTQVGCNILYYCGRHCATLVHRIPFCWCAFFRIFFKLTRMNPAPHTHACTRTYPHTRMHTYKHTNKRKRIRTHKPSHTHTHAHARMHAHTHAHTHTCMHSHTYTCYILRTHELMHTCACVQNVFCTHVLYYLHAYKYTNNHTHTHTNT